MHLDEQKEWSALSPEEKKKQLFLSQKHTLDLFLERNAVLVKQNCNTSVQNFSEKLRIYSTVSLTMSL